MSKSWSGRQGKLTEAMKAFVVQRLACFETPGQVADAVSREYGVQITPQSIEKYDPTKRAGERIAAHWRELFERTRKEFLEHVEIHIPEANRAVRIAKLARGARAMEQRGNYLGMREMLEAIAKEVGNVHTNRRELTGRDGGPVAVSYSDMTEEQLDARIAALLAAAGGDDDGDGD